jgi:hypothetical protein
VVCEGPTCSERAGGRSLRDGICRTLAAHGWTERVEVTSQICFGDCWHAPNVMVRPVGGQGRVVPRLATGGPAGARAVPLGGVIAAEVGLLVARFLGQDGPAE